METLRTVTLAMTGASGAQYGLRLLQCLLAADCRVYLLLSNAAQVVIRTETNLELPDELEDQQALLAKRYGADDDQLILFGREDWFSPVAYGYSSPSSNVIYPAIGGLLSVIPNRSYSDITTCHC